MAFWSSEKLIKKQEGQCLINPFDYGRVKHAGYELSLGTEAFITSDPYSRKQKIAKGEQVIIPPGQFGLLLADEKITIPPDAIGFISIKASIKFRGLINVSGFHVDPGFNGTLKFSVYNAGSQNIVLACGEPVFLIWFSDLDWGTKDVYNGSHAGHGEISSKDVMSIQGEIASPSGLNQRLKEIEKILDVASPVKLDQRLSRIETTLDRAKTFIITILIGGLLVSVIASLTSDYIKEKLFKGNQEQTSSEHNKFENQQPNQIILKTK